MTGTSRSPLYLLLAVLVIGLVFIALAPREGIRAGTYAYPPSGTALYMPLVMEPYPPPATSTPDMCYRCFDCHTVECIEFCMAECGCSFGEDGEWTCPFFPVGQ